jgi:hypothetical protein
MGEIEKQINNLKLDGEKKQKIVSILASATEEFPCQSCESKDECSTYNWFLKWFGSPE